MVQPQVCNSCPRGCVGRQIDFSRTCTFNPSDIRFHEQVSDRRGVVYQLPVTVKTPPDLMQVSMEPVAA